MNPDPDTSVRAVHMGPAHAAVSHRSKITKSTPSTLFQSIAWNPGNFMESISQKVLPVTELSLFWYFCRNYKGIDTDGGGIGNRIVIVV